MSSCLDILAVDEVLQSALLRNDQRWPAPQQRPHHSAEIITVEQVVNKVHVTKQDLLILQRYFQWNGLAVVLFYRMFNIANTPPPPNIPKNIKWGEEGVGEAISLFPSLYHGKKDKRGGNGELGNHTHVIIILITFVIILVWLIDLFSNILIPEEIVDLRGGLEPVILVQGLQSIRRQLQMVGSILYEEGMWIRIF